LTSFSKTLDVGYIKSKFILLPNLGLIDTSKKNGFPIRLKI